MKDQLKKVLSKHRYDQLSVDEKESLNELCLDENNSKVIGNIFNILDGLNANSTVQPRNQTKERLDYLFQNNSYSRRSSFSLDALTAFFFPPSKSFWRSPLIPVAAIVVVVFIGVRFWNEGINNVHALGLQTAQLSDVGENLREEKKQVSPNSPAKNIPEYKAVERSYPSESISSTFSPEETRMDANTSIGSYVSDDSDGLAMETEVSVTDKKETVSFRLADCPECMELITATY